MGRVGSAQAPVLEHAQLELVGGQLAQPAVAPAVPGEEAADGEHHSNVTSLEQARKKRRAQQRTGVRELPDHLPRRTVVHTPHSGCDCEACGRGLREIGQDVSEVLDYEPGTVLQAAQASLGRTWRTTGTCHRRRSIAT
ncbi:hypothetical protein QTI68_33555 [Variovorax sp. J31P207]|nr:hypothetical protein [Variovorax sp. J31P207]MDM0071504.1 hypothetical protein [Variovorax sp. J31P207]